MHGKGYRDAEIRLHEDASTVLTFDIPGIPVPKGRPRSRVRGMSFVQVYTDPKTANWEKHVSSILVLQIARLQLNEYEIMEAVTLPTKSRVAVDLVFNLPKPKSTPKYVKFPVKSRSDIDNYAKSVLDAMQRGGLIANDSTVTDLTAKKRYAETPGVIICATIFPDSI
jgi:Holliday junction resolvase RusA-like endonuclease